MNNIQKRLIAFHKLGRFISQFALKKTEKQTDIPFNDLFFEGFKHQIKIAHEHNLWFTKENIYFALAHWSQQLDINELTKFTEGFSFEEEQNKTVAIVMAGNIPLVGFHDFLAVLIAGYKVVVKLSSNDRHLLPFLSKYLEHVEPSLKGKISFTEDKLSNFDAVIATGSNNTARYFEYYFRNKPSIIRKNRNSVAVLTGNETEEDYENLSDDIFQYFGLGCRSVSKLFVPRDFSFDGFFKGMYTKKEIIKNQKYANNYDYNKAVYLMSEFDLLENGFLMIKEDSSYASPIASIFYEYYDNPIDLKIKLHEDKEQIQCIVSKGFIENEVAFGETQKPKLNDFADGINTLEFLSNLEK